MFAPQSSNQRVREAGQLLAELVDASGASKVEVWRRPHGDGSPEIELVQHLWGSGVGWYVQQRLALDGLQAQGLCAALGAIQPASAQPPTRPISVRTESEDNVIRLVFPTG
ncbi:MAG: hypothetical protein HY320_10855 [Armatimonadetes bacterium]|nr:hypothetical protein [Armatimonadota bacterium]